ncbi:MAG TPA: histidine kinase dimerization/phospho-acceptor domain-containing protein, partial [Vulgatibacter sp.]
MEALGDPIAPPDSHERPRAAGDLVDHLDLLAQASLAGAVSQLTNGLAHETRNSLNALAIHLEVLADKLREPGSDQVPANLEKNLQAARAQIRRLDDTLRRFGEFAAGRTESRDLAALFSNAASLCAYHLRRSGAELIFDLPEGVMLEGDPALLSQLAVEVVLHAAAAGAGARTRFGATATSGF